jgi:hypothetical protein
MFVLLRCSLIALAAVVMLPRFATGEEEAPQAAIVCGAAVNYFEHEVWNKVAAQKCLVCHQTGGEAEESKFLLLDPGKSEAGSLREAMRQNRGAFARMATVKEGDEYRLLLKAIGQLEHGGAEVLAPEAAGYRILADFVRQANGLAPAAEPTEVNTPPEPPMFEGVVMLDDRQLLRRCTLSLAGRLPTADELAAVEKNGREALPGILDAVMQEEAFYIRLREGFNDIFLTLGIASNPDQSVLSYDHFEKTRQWYANPELSHLKDIADAGERERAGWKLAGEYREDLLREPLKLVEYIVRNNRPFTEIVTADYIMVSPYTARGYGVWDEVKDKFKDPNDRFESIPVKIKALVGRSRDQDQESATGFYGHAGMLSTFQYLCRYPTTETNRNRLRARMYYQHFLGVDVMELAARVSDAAAVTAKYKVPTMEASECVVCHRTLDPVAGLFQDYWKFADEGIYGRRKEGWFTDMFAAGFEGEDLPAEERWRSLQWLGERTAKDPRFAIAMTGHAYYILTGRKMLLPPKDFEDPLYPARLRAYAEQRRQAEAIATRFAKNGFNLKEVFKDWIATDYYRADGLASAIATSCRQAELDDIGLMRILSPEQTERKIEAIFGEKWGRLSEQMATLYGGIDSNEVTERATDPSGAMGAIQRTLSNDVACRHVIRDFQLPAAERKLFPGIELTVIPGASAEGDLNIRQAIVRLHERILGRYDAVDSEEVERTFKLFTGIIQAAAEQQGLEKRESYFCRINDKPAPETTGDDPHYTLRAWRGVVTYLLRRPEFLYE